MCGLSMLVFYPRLGLKVRLGKWREGAFGSSPTSDLRELDLTTDFDLEPGRFLLPSFTLTKLDMNCAWPLKCVMGPLLAASRRTLRTLTLRNTLIAAADKVTVIWLALPFVIPNLTTLGAVNLHPCLAPLFANATSLTQVEAYPLKRTRKSPHLSSRLIDWRDQGARVYPF